MVPQRRVFSRRTAEAAAPPRPGRRGLLLAAAALAATGAARSTPRGTGAPDADAQDTEVQGPGAQGPEADPYDTLRRRWLGIALGTGYDPAAQPYASRLAETGELARALHAAMAPAADSLWPGHLFDPPAGITMSYSRLWTMARAHVQQGTGSTADPDLTWNRPVRRVTHTDETVEVLSTGRRLRVRVTPGKACATHVCEVTLG